MKRKTLIALAALIPLVMIAIALISLPEPDFEVVAEGDGFELRRYTAFNVAQVQVMAEFETASAQAFEPLVHYIQGGNNGGRNLPMMAPVNQQPLADGAQRGGSEPNWLVQFVMPKEYPMSYLPAPVDDRVVLQLVPSRLMAVKRYRGGWGEDRYRKHEAELLNAIYASGQSVIGEPIFARYNAPFVPGPLRRNEVLVEVADPGPTAIGPD
ncbi:MAG: heme-binding protein [Lamprobacter sp.]|uniref:SOUL family heme-binding protein n=1 Tax=Lamprobacter sp. TaxID=3100796 RepID=UPI002B25E981|nr:heme-binding protein [Lamprobacter sp.]MEA3641131.1 heme-binding protein [Lamprobacter sp.]